MKKKLLATVLALGMVVSMSGCGNRQMIDLTYNYKYAIVSLPNGEIVEGKVESLRDYEDGVTYLLHAANVVLTTKETSNG